MLCTVVGVEVGEGEWERVSNDVVRYRGSRLLLRLVVASSAERCGRSGGLIPPPIGPRVRVRPRRFGDCGRFRPS